MVATVTDRDPLLVVGDSGARSRTVDALAPLGAIVEVDDAEVAIDRLEASPTEIAGAVVVADSAGGDGADDAAGEFDADDSAGGTAVDRCERLRARYPSLPIVFVPARGAGGERVAADAVAAGATAYVPSDADEAALRERVERAIYPGGESGGNDSRADADGPRTRRELEAELETLRESEELHRVVLNHMTDTVLVTDDAGAFTYVCPNVHFIFGYSDAEIREMGTIDELLGPDLVDRDRLRERGVLTNVECTATDKRGEEHELLVNVREVDIQGGTVLYSCRDVTARKRREEALTALHRTARKLLYAESEAEIVDLVIDEAAEVLDLEASAVFLFDDDANALTPAAHSAPMERLSGPPGEFRVNAENTVGFSYLERESLFLADLEDGTGDATTAPATVVSASLPANPSTEVESAAYVPLGDHGVFVAGSESADRFDDVTRELAELLAGAAEAALDRVARESALREQDRELQERNERLARLDRINEIIREIVGGLVRAETREEIERVVCERLTAAERFSFAWIGAPDPAADDLEIRAWAGDDRGYLDSVAIPAGGGAGAEPAARTAATREVTVVSNVADGLREAEWRREALARDYQSVISVPLAYDEFSYGVLTVYADRPDAFDDVSRPVLEEVGETIASSMGALERKSALLTASSTRLEFDVRDEEFVFTRLARAADCRLTFDGGARGTADGASVFATVSDGAADAVAAAARDLVSVESAQVITGDGDGGGTVRLELSGAFIALRLAEHGVILRRVIATADGARLLVDVPRGVDARGTVDVLESAFEDVELRSKETVERSNVRDLRSELRDRLTDRQLEVVEVAYYGGYYEEPRERSGEAVAETLGISPAAFYRHNRTVQRKLFETLFDGTEVATGATGEVE